MNKTINVTGLILAGGRAQRMGGIDKGLIKLRGRSMVEYIIEALRSQVDTILINANRNLDKYSKLGLKVIKDEIDDYQGPLAGIASGLSHAETDFIVTAPCDGPFLASNYVSRLYTAAQENNANISVAFDGKRLQPVYALINTSLLPSLLAYLHAGDRKIDLWYQQENFVQVDFSTTPKIFTNINTPEELKNIENSLVEGK
jgi:molybdenum cofactor guanylyltransferase